MSFPILRSLDTMVIILTYFYQNSRFNAGFFLQCGISTFILSTSSTTAQNFHGFWVKQVWYPLRRVFSFYFVFLQSVRGAVTEAAFTPTLTFSHSNISAHFVLHVQCVQNLFHVEPTCSALIKRLSRSHEQLLSIECTD